jgi:hypothetical protein
MNKISTLLIAATLNSVAVIAQTQLTNAGFENWGNASPGVSTEPTNWYSNKSGSNTAQLGSQTCFQDATAHTGSYSVKIETESLNLGFTTEIINGNVTTGVVNAPTTTKSDGYIGTINYSTSSDDRRMAFTGRPDSIVGWYQYTQGGSAELGKIRAILHTGDYYDPETPTKYHPDPTANKIADALFLTPTSNISSWTRFSVPFNYVSTSNPAYVMVNITSSDDQNTSTAGSIMLIDDISMIYNASAGINQLNQNQSIKVFYTDKTVYVDFLNRSSDQSTLSIFDLTGKLMSSQQIENNKLNSVNVSTFDVGMYLYQITGSTYQKAGRLIVD